MTAFARLCRFGAVALLLAWAPPGAAQEQPQPQPQAQQPQVDEDLLGEQVMGSMLFIFFHELGHAYIDQLELPAVGPEEDVADEFAIFILIAVAKDGEQFAHRALINAAESWRLMWLEIAPLLRDQPERFPFWDEHNLDIKRFYNIVCLLYGSDAGSFWPLTVQTGIPVERARKCEDEYQQKWAAWQKLMEPHLVPEGQAPPADLHRFNVTYGSADTDVARGLGEVFQRDRTWEALVEPLGQNIVMPNDIDIFVRSCGVENAWWDPISRSITLCYEMIEFLSRLFIKANQAELAANQAPAGQPQPAPPEAEAPAGQPQPTPAGPLPPGPPPFGGQPGTNQPLPQQPAPQAQIPRGPVPMIDQRLVGVWQAQSNLQGASMVTRLSLNQDGTFVQISYGSNSAPFYLWGSYSVENGRIRFAVGGWQPQQICGQQGCAPVRIPQQEFAQFQLMGPTTMQLRELLFYRMQ